MMHVLISLLAALLFAPPAIAQSNERNIVKDSIYFTLDDGIMTAEEMEEEAQYVYGQCTRNLYQNNYFDCQCIAGAFLRERETRGPLALQEDILTELYRSGGQTAKCGNGPKIAGTAYNDCMNYAATFRRLETNNAEYCRCVGNRVARNFVDYPYLRTAYISRLRVNALVSCERQFPVRRDYY